MTPVKVCCLYKAAVTQIQCTAAPVVGKKHSQLLNAAVEVMLTAALRHCNDTCEDFLLIQSCPDPNLMHCSSCCWQKAFSAAQCCCESQADSSLATLYDTCEDFLLIQSCSDPNLMHCSSCCWQKAFCTAQCCCDSQADSSLATLQ